MVPRVSIVVVSYNTSALTRAALASVIAETSVPYELIVIDNASPDGSAADIAADFPDITLMADDTNHGFAAANNIAAKHATGDYLLLLNPDTVVLDGAIDKLVAFADANPSAKIWGGRTWFDEAGTLNPASCWGQITLWNTFCRTAGLTGLFPRAELFNGEAFGAWDRSTERQVDIVSGCFLMLPRTLWETLGGFDLRFVMYGEEADLCLRATRDHGAAPRVTPTANIVHYGGASEAVRADKMVRLMNAKIALINTHVPAWQRGLTRALFAAWPLSRMIACKALGRRDAAATWSEIWARRPEWRAGYQ